MDVGEVKARLVADLSNWTENLKGAQGDLLKLGTASVAVGNILSQLAEQALTAGLAIVRFPIEAATAAGKAAEQFDQLAQRTGIAVQSLEGLQVAMAREGIGTEALAQGFRKLSQEMVGVRDRTAASVDLFTKLGVSLDVADKSTGTVLYAIADRFKVMADGAEKSRLAVELFGRGGLLLIPILNQGSAGLDAAMRKAAEFGLILTRTQQTDLKTFDDSLDDMQSALKGFQAQVGAAFAPAFTALVHGLTNAVVMAKDAFNFFADGAEKLVIRLSAIVAVIELVGKNMASMKAFSIDAWSNTIDHIKAIDQWASAELKGVDASRLMSNELEKQAISQMGAAEAAKVHAQHQKVLGEQIVATTQVQLSQQAKANREYFFELFALEEQAAQSRYLAGPDAGVGSAKAQELAGSQIVQQAQVTRQIARQAALDQVSDAKMAADSTMAVQAQMYQDEAGLIGAAEAARRVAFAQIDADLDVQKLTQEQLYDDGKLTAQQYYAHLENLEQQSTAKRMQIVRQYPTFWEQQLNAIVQSNAFSMSTIINQASGAMANWIVQGTKFKQFWISLQTTMVQAVINLGVQELVQWGLLLLKRQGLEAAAAAKLLAGHTALETAKTTITTTEESARSVITIAQAKVAGAGAIAVMTGIAEASIGVLEGIVVAIAGVFEAMAAALAASIVGAEFAPGMAAAGAAAFSAGTAATGTASASITAAIAAATGAIALAEGGVVSSPTLALIGERGREAVVPLDSGGGFGNQTIILMQDGRELTRTVLKNMPREVRLRMGNRF